MQAQICMDTEDVASAKASRRQPENQSCPERFDSYLGVRLDGRFFSSARTR
jgi:hypothetical protein